MKANTTVPTKESSSCSLCGGTGFISEWKVTEKTRSMYGDEPQEFVRTCDCVLRERSLERKKKFGLSDGLLDTFKDEEEWQKRIKALATQYSRHGKGWFFISGQRGCGKSHLCSGISDVLIERKQVVYMGYEGDIRRLKMGADEWEIDRFKKCPYLLIDDLFKTEPTKAEIQIIYEIINYRYERDLPCIINSEHSPDRLADIDEAISSRIVEKAGRYLINVPDDENKNYRLKKGKSNG